MIQIIAGRQGKGKTKQLLDKVNAEIKAAHGNIVYLDKSSKHMYELNNKIRLIDVSEFDLQNGDEFMGFICGLISQDHDLEHIYLDGFLKIACLEGTDRLEEIVGKLDSISENYQFKITASVSLDETELPEALKSKVIVSL